MNHIAKPTNMPFLRPSSLPLVSEPTQGATTSSINEKEKQRDTPVLEIESGKKPTQPRKCIKKIDAGLTLQERIRLALSVHLGLSPEHIRTQHNKEKYRDANNAPDLAGPELQEVVQLMKGLNETALNDDSIASARDGSGGFRETLVNTARDIARHFDGKEFLYVELGPEPTKTVFLIQELLRHGAQIRRYIAVDINPASKRVMQQALSGILEEDRIVHKLTLFEDFCVDDVRDRNTLPPALVTTLGFQEGNEDPALLPALYRKMLGPGDVLLSEMQLRPDDDSTFDAPPHGNLKSVQSFYHHPYMRRFSRIAWERVFGNHPSRGGLAFVPDGRYADQDLWAAVLYETPEGSSPVHSFVLPEVFVTNYCLKYSRHQFRKLRESLAFQKILGENLTGDASVAFQLSLRV